MKIYNSLTNEMYKLNKSSKINLYVCGVTLYDDCHIGHGRVFLFFDSLVRYLKYSGFDVNFCRNITDIDDKILNRSSLLEITPKELVSKYKIKMDNVLSELNCNNPDFEPMATDYIEEIISSIKEMIDKKFAYSFEGDVYFDISKIENYGCLSKNVTINNYENSNNRLNVKTFKKNENDFVLWKRSDSEFAYDSEFGKGLPGWHTECVVMGKHILGKQFDIHGGGMDLKFPHHENEIAQSYALDNCIHANQWMHVNFVTDDKNQKMSKSLNNFYTIDDVLQIYHPDVIRFFILSTQYRKPLKFTLDLINPYFLYMSKCYNEICNADLGGGKITESFIEFLDNDFNTVGALEEVKLAILNSDFKSAKSMLFILGFKLDNKRLKYVNLTDDEIQYQIFKRQNYKDLKDYESADKIKMFLKSNNIQLHDNNKNTTYTII